MKNAIRQHHENLSPDAIWDIHTGQLDEVITDALYAAAEATTPEEMAEARALARDLARPLAERLAEIEGAAIDAE